MRKPALDGFLDWLRDEFGESLRWVASFDSDRFTYKVRYVRDDLRTDLTDRQLNVVIHRSMAVYNRTHLEDVYDHLGEARALVVQHEQAMAAHVYWGAARGVVVKLDTDASITVPEFTEDATAKLFPDAE